MFSSLNRALKECACSPTDVFSRWQNRCRHCGRRRPNTDMRLYVFETNHVAIRFEKILSFSSVGAGRQRRHRRQPDIPRLREPDQRGRGSLLEFCPPGVVAAPSRRADQRLGLFCRSAVDQLSRSILSPALAVNRMARPEKISIASKTKTKTKKHKNHHEKY